VTDGSRPESLPQVHRALAVDYDVTADYIEQHLVFIAVGDGGRKLLGVYGLIPDPPSRGERGVPRLHGGDVEPGRPRESSPRLRPG